MESRSFKRVKAVAQAGTGQLRAGCARVDLTPGFLTPMTGWAIGKATRAHGWFGRLTATTLALEDADGKRVALVAADLHAGSRFIAEQVALETASLGVGLAELFLAGTHTHSGPGNFYGAPYFDEFAGAVGGVDEANVEWLVGQLVDCVTQAFDSLAPAAVGFGDEALHGWSHNRSLEGYLANFPGLPTTPDTERLAVDPMVRVVWAQHVDTGAPIGGFATFAAHGTMMSTGLAIGGPDWFGPAMRTAERALKLPAGAYLGLAAGAVGDVDPAHPNYSQEALMSTRATPGGAIRLITMMGDAVGNALADAVDDAVQRGLHHELSLDALYAEPTVVGAKLSNGRQLAVRAEIGTSTLAGSEMGRSGVCSEGRREDTIDENDPQSPKPIAHLLPVRDRLVMQRPTVPLRLVRLTAPGVPTIALLGAPGEPTTTLAQHFRDALGLPDLIVSAVNGDYGGYLTTVPEYESQQYEGASTLWGRFYGAWLVEQYQALAAAGASSFEPSITFPISPAGPFRLDNPPPPGSGVPEWPVPPSCGFDATSNSAHGSWFGYAPEKDFELGLQPWVQVRDAKTGAVLFDDTTHFIFLSLDVSHERIEWKWWFQVPPELLGRSIQVEALGPAGPRVKPPSGSAWPTLTLK